MNCWILFLGCLYIFYILYTISDSETCPKNYSNLHHPTHFSGSVLQSGAMVYRYPLVPGFWKFFTTACPPSGSTIHVTKFCPNSKFFSRTCPPSKTATGLSKGSKGSSSSPPSTQNQIICYGFVLRLQCQEGPSIGERVHLDERCGGKGTDGILGVIYHLEYGYAQGVWMRSEEHTSELQSQ